MRHARANQAQAGLSGREVDSLVEPGPAVGNCDDLDIEDAATPPARFPASLPGAGSRSSRQMPAAPSLPSSPMATVSAQSSGQMPGVVPGRSSGQIPVADHATDEMQVTPPPPVPLPPAVSILHRPALAIRPAFGLLSFHVSRRAGGVAAIKRSRRGLWLFVLVVLAVLLGFSIVRFVAEPTDAQSQDSVFPAGNRTGLPRASALDALVGEA